MISNTATATAGSPAGIPFSQLLNDYRLSLEAANRSPKTISWYAEILQRYSEFLESAGLLKPIDELGREELRAYVVHLQNTTRWSSNPHIRAPQGKLSAYSIQGHVRAIKAFFSWLKTEEYIDHNSLDKFPLPKVPQNAVKTLTPEQITTLLSSVDRHSAVGAKYYCILLLLLDTGMRISELVSITMEDLDLSQSVIRVLGKGQKWRIVPFCKETRKELVRYINHSRTTLGPQDSGYLFHIQCGDHISVGSVQQFIRRLVVRAGLDGVKCSPHTFRHTFATQSIANEANLYVLKDIMGHSSLQTTQKYIHLQASDLKAQHAKFSPVANLKGVRS